MRSQLFHLIILVYLFTTLSSGAQVMLADERQSDYRIVIPVSASPVEEKAAGIFRQYFEQVSGVSLPVITDDQQAVEHEIIIGNSSRLDQFRIKHNPSELGQDGFIIRTSNNRVFITGGNPVGTLNGVYTFLEDYLNCRFYSPGVQFIPSMRKIALPKIKDRQVPFFAYREMYFPGRWDKDYLEWHKLHTHHSGQWGMWVHTFKDLIPPREYFSSNPEFFSEINGTRVPNGQLCLTQPEVYTVLVSNLKKKMDANRKAIYWSVSQNDNYLACQCQQCKDASVRLGGESGIMIDFVNRVAERFPDKVISTLAYQYTRMAPSHVKPLPNVNIMLCSIECNRSRPIASDPTGHSFVKDIRDWTRLTDNILIWDYLVQFRNYISPFPNLHVLQPNLEFFAKNGCRLMFQQGSGTSLSEFVELRSYMIAKLLWNPRLNAEAVMDDFLAGYYRAAAPYLKDYINLIHEELENSGATLRIFGSPMDGINSFLRPAIITEYERLFDLAEEAVAGDEVILQRVRVARLPLEFAIFDISLHGMDGQLSWFEVTDGTLKAKEYMLNRLDAFVNRCEMAGINVLNEKGLTPEEYRQQIREYVSTGREMRMDIDR